MIELIAIDMDGTLLNSAHQITQNVQKALNDAIDSGIKIVLCTGRPLKAIYPYVEQLDLSDKEDYVISLNGTLVQKTNTQEIVYSHQLKRTDLNRLNYIRKGYQVNLTYFDETHYFYTGEKTDRLMFDANILGMEPVHLEIADIPEETIIYKAMYVGEPSEIDRLAREIPEDIKQNFYPIRSLPYIFEILPKKANKGDALIGLVETLGIPIENVMAIGDGENDIDLMNAVVESVAMGNATDTIKAAAKHQTKSNEEDGVSYAIYQWALN